ncbi:MAG: ABC transporter ATP-binding protein [Flavobacteriales bacterium]|nr:ABC transporter ATP-binding protein [Flavobacteriales bacterium]
MKPLFHLNKYLAKYKWYLLLGFLFIIFSNLFKVYMPAIVDQAADEISNYFKDAQNGDVNTRNELWNAGLKLSLVYLAYAFISGLFLFLTRQTIIVMSRKIEYDLKNDIFDHYQSLSMSFFKKNNTGDLMNRISEDVGKVRMYLGPAIMYTLNVFVLFTMVITFMFNKNVSLTLYVLTPLPILSFIIYKISFVINKKSEKTQKQQSMLSTFVQEAFSGIRVLKAYNRQAYFQDNFKNETENYKRASLSLAFVNSFFLPAIVLLIGLSTILTIYIGGIKTINNEIDYGDILQFIFYINLLTWPFASIGWVTSLIQRAAASQKRINEFLLQNETIENLNPEHQIGSINSLAFSNVFFEYEQTNIKALNNITFQLNKGQTLGIIGRTGSGKSTIANLICRLYDLNNGTIQINSKEINEFNLFSLRAKIGYVPQDVFLFSDTIKNNILFGIENDNIDAELVINAAKQAQIHEDIMDFPEKYNTKIGERGITLSGGQKQRISIARALIRKPDVLILDDCLSAVDTETEDKILKNLYSNVKSDITVIIGHRISSVSSANQIIVLEKGSIVENGNHSELIKKQGYYYEIHKKQLMEKKQ